MIQTAEQYVFLYRTLIEGILTVDTSISLQEFLSTKKLRVDSKSQYKVRGDARVSRFNLHLSFELASGTITIIDRIFLSKCH